MLHREEAIRDAAVRRAVEEVALAVRTAPKTRGLDKLVILVADGEDQEQLAAKMDEINVRTGGGRPSFTRDAQGVKTASASILVGAKTDAYGLNCGFCGYPTCAEKNAHPAPCAFGPIDLGIAAGVAAVKFAEKHIDNRMMFSMGYAAMELGWFGDGVTVALGFPLSATGKNPFFDRK